MDITGYRIERRIGQGGMAMVYLATQESLQRPVALKVLNPVHSDTPEFTERFLNEGRMLASLGHSNIIIIHDIGVADAVHYIAMEYVEGGDLKQRIRRGVTVPEALGYAETVARALHYAHEKGIVHRDVKPANVMFRRDGTLVLTDFGIAKQLDGDADLTVAGATIGSPHYLSPEQARGKGVDARADIYSVGIMLYEMLTGTRPYRGDSEIDTVLKHLTEPPPCLPPEHDVLQPLLERLLAKKVDERIESALRVADALRDAREQWPGQAPVPEPAPPPVAPAPATPDLPHESGSVDREAATVVDEQAVSSGAGGWLKLVSIGVAVGVAILIAALLAGRAYFSDLLQPEPADTSASAPAPSLARETAAATARTQLPGDRGDLRDSTGAITSPGAPPGPGQPVAEPARATPRIEATASDTRSPTQPGPDTRLPGAGTPQALTASDAPAAKPGAPGPAPALPELPEAPRRPPAADVATAPEPVPAPVPAPRVEAPTTVEAAPAETNDAARIAALLESASRAIEEFRLTRPEGDSALDYIEQVLVIDPRNQAARASFKRIAERYAVLARSGIGKSDYAKARLYVDRGLEVDAANTDLQALDAELARLTARKVVPASRISAVNDSAPVAANETAAAQTNTVQGETPAELFKRIKNFFQ